MMFVVLLGIFFQLIDSCIKKTLDSIPFPGGGIPPNFLLISLAPTITVVSGHTKNYEKTGKLLRKREDSD